LKGNRTGAFFKSTSKVDFFQSIALVIFSGMTTAKMISWLVAIAPEAFCPKEDALRLR
jgi:hypothetical protein